MADHGSKCRHVSTNERQAVLAGQRWPRASTANPDSIRVAPQITFEPRYNRSVITPSAADGLNAQCAVRLTMNVDRRRRDHEPLFSRADLEPEANQGARCHEQLRKANTNAQRAPVRMRSERNAEAHDSVYYPDSHDCEYDRGPQQAPVWNE